MHYPSALAAFDPDVAKDPEDYNILWYPIGGLGWEVDFTAKPKRAPAVGSRRAALDKELQSHFVPETGKTINTGFVVEEQQVYQHASAHGMTTVRHGFHGLTYAPYTAPDGQYNVATCSVLL